ncbi:hypothetical protein B5X24_HaOG211516 [Helicoverpa armigera]|nr:hypothetical protein B5X24_HaOG211516 [Helicoverpa armigera]
MFENIINPVYGAQWLVAASPAGVRIERITARPPDTALPHLSCANAQFNFLILKYFPETRQSAKTLLSNRKPPPTRIHKHSAAKCFGGHDEKQAIIATPTDAMGTSANSASR